MRTYAYIQKKKLGSITVTINPAVKNHYYSHSEKTKRFNNSAADSEYQS